MDNKNRRLDSVVGIALIGAFVTGLAGLVGALVAFGNAEWTGAGLCLAAAALAFGMTANAILRD